MHDALQNIGISLAFCFIVLLMSTRKIMQTLIAIFCVTFIMASVICVMVLNGQELGISESIGVVILIGMSVDYVVHLAAHFVNSKKATTLEKLQESYHEIAISITSAANTTFGCGMFLFGGKNLVFKKFATMICVTILLSFVVSMTLFGALTSYLD